VSHLVIAEVSEFLRHTLWLGIREDSTTSQLVTAEQSIVLSNPAQVALPQGVVRQMSLWLYHVVPNEHLRNGPFVRRRDPANQNDDDAQFYPPLVLNLLYLLTPSIQSDGNGADQLADQRLLGRAMQILHDQAVLPMQSKEAPGDGTELHLSLAPRTIEELAQVWEAMQQPYRLSVCYEVRVVRIPSLRRRLGTRVAERSTEFSGVGN
jgi:Pvc16 N-terminal domain